MKRLFALLLASAALVFALSACGSKPEPMIESQGLFLMEPGSDFEYYGVNTWESGTGLSEDEAYLILVYDILPPESDTAELTSEAADYSITLNGETVCESLSPQADDHTLLNIFVTGSFYADPLEGLSIAAGDDPVRAVSVFQVNQSDITEDTTVEFTVANNDVYDCALSFSAEDIQTIDLFDRIFSIEESPEDAQKAAAYYAYALNMYSYLSSASASDLEMYSSGIIITEKTRTYGVPSATGDLIIFSIPVDELNQLDDDADSCTEYQRIKAAAALPALDPETVKSVHPEIADDIDTLESNLTAWCESFRAYINSYGTDGADETNSARSAAMTAAQNIINFYQGNA